jgi:hypothetical protein
MRWLLIRCVLWGGIIGAGLHALIAFGLNVSLPPNFWIKYYLSALVAFPALMLGISTVHFLVPRAITVQPTALIIHEGGVARPLLPDCLLRWRFFSIGKHQAFIVVALRYAKRRRGMGTLTLGLSRNTDLRELDRQLRAVTRLARFRSRRKQQKRIARSRITFPVRIAEF